MRRMADVALPAFIFSMGETRSLICTMNHCPNGARPACVAFTAEEFPARKCPDLDQEPLTQRHMDELTSRHRPNNLLREANQDNRPRNVTHGGAWLSVLPAEKLGFLLSNEIVPTGVAFRLGTPIQQPHFCRCGTMSDRLDHPTLSSWRDLFLLPRCAALNDVIYRTMVACVVAVLEPMGLDRGDSRRPDGIIIFPFR